MLYLVPIISIIVVGNESENCRVINKLDDEIGGGRGRAIMGEQSVEQGDQHAPLGGSSVDNKGGGGVTVHSDTLFTVCQKVYDPVAQSAE